MTSLGDVVAALGGEVVHVLHDAGNLEEPVPGVAIHDPHEPGTLPRGTLVLGIVEGAGATLAALMDRAAGQGHSLAIKVGPAEHATVARDAERLGVTVIAVDTGASWMHMLSLLRSIVGESAAHRSDERLGVVVDGDLFALANAIGAMIDAPVTIEDPQSRVIAYSAGQERADEARMATILGREIPLAFAEKFRSEGLFRRLSREPGPLYLDDIAVGVMPRLAVAVRAGDEVLGSIWAAVPSPPPPEKVVAFGDAARIVAIHLLRHRVAADLRRGLHADLVALVLSGGPSATNAAARLNLDGAAFRVLAAGVREGDSVDNEALLLRLADLLAVHLALVQRRATSAVVGGVAYAIVPVPADSAAGRLMARQLAEGFLARLPAALARQTVVAVGGHASSLASVPPARDAADHVLRLLRRKPAGPATSDIETMATQVLLARLSDLAGDDALVPDGPLVALREHDRGHRTEYVATLRAFLETFGDVPAASRLLAVHQNTFRYRLQRLQETPGLDLNDPDQRLSLLLQLRILELRAGRHLPEHQGPQ